MKYDWEMAPRSVKDWCLAVAQSVVDAIMEGEAPAQRFTLEEISQIFELKETPGEPKVVNATRLPPTHIHFKTQGLYRKIGEGKLEALLQPVTIYEGEGWVNLGEANTGVQRPFRKR